jgi:CheY-like chemotaxis protein
MMRKEQLLGISELNTGRIGSMSDIQFSNYLQTVNSFIDRFPSQAEDMRGNVNGKAYGILAGTLSVIADVLGRIFADNLAQEVRALINTLKADARSIDQDDIESAIEGIIQRVSAMSIDVQMSGHRSGAAPRTPRTGGAKRRIVAVDNAVMYLNMLKKLLQDHPYEVICTTSCAEALQLVQSERPDVLLLDIEMPEMDGYELARRIQQGGCKAPLIFITANSAREYVDKAVAVGAVALLMKPLRINQLLAKLKEFA